MTGLKLWVDDLRDPPDGTWKWAKTSADAIFWLDGPMEFGDWSIGEMSLDHDLGGDDTTRPVVLWLCEHPDAWPMKVSVHSMNNVGVIWLVGMLDRYAPVEVVVVRHGIVQHRSVSEGGSSDAESVDDNAAET